MAPEPSPSPNHAAASDSTHPSPTTVNLPWAWHSSTRSLWALLSGILGATASACAKLAFASGEATFWPTNVDGTAAVPPLEVIDSHCPLWTEFPTSWALLQPWMECHFLSQVLPRLVTLVAMILCNVAMVACFVGGLQDAGSIAGTALATASNFLTAALWGALFWQETPVSWMGLGMVVTGTVLLVGGQQPGSGS